MFGVGPTGKLVILGGICLLFIVGLVAVIVIVMTMSNKKSNDE